jgi:uncharacterized protein
VRVCAAVAGHLGLDVILVRLAMALLVIVTGCAGLVGYRPEPGATTIKWQLKGPMATADARLVHCAAGDRWRWQTMTVDGSESAMQVLDGDECYRLLATQEIGRLGVNAEHYPLIFPVNYGLDDGVLVIRTHSGTMLSAAAHANVTVEVDEIDRRTRTGWSILVRGLAEEVTSAHRSELIQRTKAAGVTPWAPGEYGRWLRVIPQHITGRRIVPGHLPPAFGEAAGYP